MEKWNKLEAKVKKFELEGDNIEGKLVAIEPTSQFGNRVYKIETEEGVFAVFGTAVLDSVLSGVSIGSELRIVFTGTKPSKTKGQNPMKMFEVFTR